jgi:Flp pilus assembly protein TadB
MHHIRGSAKVDIFCDVRCHRTHRFWNGRSGLQEASMSIFTIFFVILLVAWILGFGVFHVAGALIHLLLILALISLVLHFVRGPRAA